MPSVRRSLRQPSFVLAILLAAACGKDSTSPHALSKIVVSVASATISAGSTTTATAAGVSDNGGSASPGTITWSSGSTAIATVDPSTGVITGVAPGTTFIMATAGTVVGVQSITVMPAPPVVTTVVATISAVQLTFGQTATAAATARDQYGLPISTAGATWTSSTPAVATVNATTGVVTGVGVGATTITGSVGGKTATVIVNVSVPAIRVNEVESNGGTPGDWIELINAGATAVDISGWGVRDNDSTHTIYRIPAGTSIPAGGYFVVEEAQFGFGLGAADDARLYNQFTATVDLYSWTAHAAITYGRCPNGTGSFINTGSSTKGTVNDCSTAAPPPPPPGGSAWPGTDDVVAVDGTAVFGGNLSGLMYESAASGNPNVLWAARNGPGSIFRLIFSGGIWTPDPANGWVAGKVLQYPDGTGEPDSEGITTAGGSANGVYVSAERDNKNNGVSRNSVLRYDITAAGTTLRATNEWNLTSDLPVTGANLGAEAITWIPDAVLVARGFFDEKANKVYAPADYPNHGAGLFFVGLEANGIIYAYALDHVTNGFARIATIATGYPAGVMDLSFDPATNYLWAECDDGCGGLVGILEIDLAAGSPTRGRFLAPRKYNRPSSMPNLNNEGFTVTTQAECVAGFKPVFWSDDSETGGHSIRRASLPCGTITAAVQVMRAAGTNRF